MPSATESALIDSIRPRLHPRLKPLFDESSRCLPILQSTCQQILNDTDQQFTPDNLVQVISRDHGLTCKVLQVANSIAYSPQQTIGGIPHAVSWLGLDTVRALVAAAHLVEQLQHWPARQQELRTLIAKSLVSATYANEFGTAISYPQPGQLFTSALLYAIGDLAVAYQDPDLFEALQAMYRKVKHQADRVSQETKLIGVPRLTLARALARLWKLPDNLVHLFDSTGESPTGRWQSASQTYRGLVVGSIHLVDVMTGSGSAAAVEEAKRALQLGSGLSSGRFTDLMTQAMDRGLQLTRSMGLVVDPVHDPLMSSNGKSPAESPALRSSAKTAPGEDQATAPQRVSPTHDAPPVPIRSNPLETLQAFQDSLQGVKDLNSLLGIFIRSLHRDAGLGRVGLALLNPSDSDRLVGKLTLGVEPPAPYLSSLSGSLSREHPFFLSMLKRVDPLLVPSVSDQPAGAMKQDFLDVWRPTSAILAPLRVGVRPIGLVYCDQAPDHPPLHAQDYQAFQFFFFQTTLAMNRLAGVL
ncbi:MAG: HDOD domain-containing protein [Nitrospira sp.]|nr:HDOD domain-containing protein [Nitrospira sp.]MDH4304638.1 HDOD domain-containing protein [Nitrospira sp.]MDH5194067.1 HDOD domain-containing protein [Nitrospira sp.]